MPRHLGKDVAGGLLIVLAVAVAYSGYAFSDGAFGSLKGAPRPAMKPAAQQPGLSAPVSAPGQETPAQILARVFDSASEPTAEELAGERYRLYLAHMISSAKPRETVDVNIIMGRVCADGSERKNCELSSDKVKMVVLARPIAPSSAAMELANASNFLMLRPGAVPKTPLEGSPMGGKAFRTNASVVNSYAAVRKAPNGHLIMRHVFHDYDSANLAPAYSYVPQSQREGAVLWHGYFMEAQ